ncbi:MULTISPECIES: cytochrome b [Chryseobacterium]|uniref:cytochrome b n=1 Tax=Chryseobacterium TaxID=59732 RepID=UPI00187507EC|nr:cytochrome b [Chryseobacterium culicis]MBE4948195.1 cytochrome b [Chryseobacterium culicis]
MNNKKLTQVPPSSFNSTAQILHWLMAAMILTMLFVGVGMMTSLTLRPWLLDLHIPLGVAVLLLVSVRLINRLTRPVPKLPDEMPGWQKYMATILHWVFYALMFALPLSGWAQLSAGGFPVRLYPGFHLPAILEQNPTSYAWLHDSHRIMAWAFFFMIVGHLSAALIHGFIYRDNILQSMIGQKKPTDKSEEICSDQ